MDGVPLKACLIEGPLLKKSVWLKKWNPRYFRVRGRTLCYYEKDTSRIARGEIPLIGSKIAPIALDEMNRQFAIIVTTSKGEDHILCAADEDDRIRWIDAMKSVVEKRPSVRKPVTPPSASSEHDDTATKQVSELAIESDEDDAPFDSTFVPPPPPPDATDPLSYLMGMSTNPKAGPSSPKKKKKSTVKPKKKSQVKTREESPKVSSRPVPTGSFEALQRTKMDSPTVGSSDAEADEDGRSTGILLRNAVKKGDIERTKQLIEQDASLACFQDDQSQTVLHVAAMFNHEDICSCLIAAGADPTIKNRQGETPIDIAALSLGNKMRAQFQARNTN
mmetsp:Transcript_13289/g.21702  ORF Transcript_13289/g.21702 Transcript_13289/m.21702 type:complete len:334 (+) Transcript_13289:222-1223(+)